MTIKDFAAEITNEIYNSWGCDPAYFCNSDDAVEAALATRDSYLIEFINSKVSEAMQHNHSYNKHGTKKEKCKYNLFDGDYELQRID